MGSDMDKICSVVLVDAPFCIINAKKRECFNGGDLLLIDAVSREAFLPYVNFMSEVFINEKTLKKYMENYGDLSREKGDKIAEIIRVPSPDYALMSSVFSYINARTTYSGMFHEMMVLSCISLFSTQSGFVSFVQKTVNSTVQKVKMIICTDLSKAWRIRDVCARIHISESLLKKRLRLEGSSFSEIVLDMRMRKAYSLIRSGHSVFQTSVLCGYANASYFICQFRKYFGTTPFRCGVKNDSNHSSEVDETGNQE